MHSTEQRAGFVPTLVLSEHFLPACGGTITWLVQTYSRYDPDEVVFVVGQCADTQLTDQMLPFQVERIQMTMADWDPTQPASLWRYLQMFRKVRSSSFRHRVKQLHCMKVLPEGLVAWGMRNMASVPYLLYAHGEEILMRLTSRKLGWLIPRLYKGAAAIIANTHHTKTLLEDIGVLSEKIHVIHPGVDGAAFRVGDEAGFIVRQRHNLGTAPVLLTVGRLQRRKGQDMVIQALPSIKEKFPDVKYLIVGTGEEFAALQQLARDVEVQDKVIFAGQVSDSEQAAYYAACNVFIMPNRQIGADIEGFGMVFLEAGAVGKPVIGGKSGGTGEAIVEGVTGLRVDGTSVETIAAAVIDLLSNPARARSMGELGRRRVEAEFTWQSVVRRTRMLSAAIQANGLA
jgi:phosphatidylinositol alpha-1,6-mannosyltransferase